MAVTLRPLLAVSALSSLCLMIVPPSEAQSSNRELAADYFSAVLRGNLRGAGGKPFRLQIECVSSKGQKSSAVNPNEYLGTDGEPPRCIISKLKLTISGNPILFPKRGVHDLANATIPTGVYLTTYADTVVLHLRGGDGSGAYKVRFIIEHGRVTAREVESLDSEGKPHIRREDLRDH